MSNLERETTSQHIAANGPRFGIRPRRIQAWRQEELADRLLMRDVAWIDAVPTPR